MSGQRKTGRHPSLRCAWGLLFTLLIGLIPGAVGCRADRATAEDCGQVLDRIVELELTEKGFHDPALVDRKRQELRSLLQPELKQCQGQRLQPGALACVRQATSPEQISHQCLR
jgi:hypothetical protein